MNYPSDNRRYVIDRVQQVFLQSFNHAVNLETLEILVSNMIWQAFISASIILFVKNKWSGDMLNKVFRWPIILIYAGISQHVFFPIFPQPLS